MMGATYWAISHETLSGLLYRAHAGESPGLLLAELYANSDVEQVEGRDPS